MEQDYIYNKSTSNAEEEEDEESIFTALFHKKYETLNICPHKKNKRCNKNNFFSLQAICWKIVALAIKCINKNVRYFENSIIDNYQC